MFSQPKTCNHLASLTGLWLMVISGFGTNVIQAQEVASDTNTFLTTFCFQCHGEQPDEGLHSLSGLNDLSKDSGSREHWEKVFRQVKSRAMPPIDAAQPTEEERKTVVQALDEMLSWVDPNTMPDPGHVTVRRLNRQEYDNTVRDLFGLNIKPGAQLFPDDNVGYGFDNIGDVLSVSPLRMQSYLEAAELITDAMFYDGASLLMERRTVATTFKRQGKNKAFGEGAILWPTATSADEIEFPVTGEYELEISLFGLLPENELKRRGLEEQNKWDPPKEMPEFDKDAPLTQARVMCDEQPISVVDVWHGGFWHKQSAKMRFQTTAGRHAIRIQNQPHSRYSSDEIAEWQATPEEAPRLGLHVLQIRGPFAAQPEQLHPHHRRLLTTVPSADLTVKAAAIAALKPLMYSAFRRPVEQSELDDITGYVDRMVSEGRTFPQALKLATQTILVSPHFLFRLEPGSTPQNPELIHPVGDYVLASRLSYCLWKTLPDETLLELAERNELHQENVLRTQVARMLDDTRSSEFVHSFFGQWLGTQKILDVKLDRNLYPAFSTAIKNDLLTESMMFAESIMRENRSVLDILRADYSFMNKRLTAYYGLKIEDLSNAEFRRVTLDGLPRRGMLTQGGILMLTSYPNRTSPTKRGKWILETILNEEPPPPPADVPSLENSSSKAADVSLRQQLEEHRRNPRCASCHQVMDSIGFGLENFDAAGQWRDKDGETVLDAAGTLPTGESFSGPVDLIEILLQREEEFVRCVVEKLMTFALGRGVEYYDRPAIDRIIRRTKKNNYRFNDLIAEIVLSRPFMLQRGEGIEP